MKLALIKFVAMVILGTAGSAYAGALLNDRAEEAAEPVRVRVLTIETAAATVCDGEVLLSL